MNFWTVQNLIKLIVILEIYTPYARKERMNKYEVLIGIDHGRNRDSPGSIRLGTAKAQVQVPDFWSRDPTPTYLESNLQVRFGTSGSSNRANMIYEKYHVF